MLCIHNVNNTHFELDVRERQPQAWALEHEHGLPIGIVYVEGKLNLVDTNRARRLSADSYL